MYILKQSIKEFIKNFIKKICLGYFALNHESINYFEISS